MQVPTQLAGRASERGALVGAPAPLFSSPSLGIGVPLPEGQQWEGEPEHGSDDITEVDAHQRLTIFRAMM